MADMAEGHLGELTSVGARQHRGIAKRMYTNFPQIFADGTEVDARSTVVIRCILSMTSECLQLQAMNPNLCIKNDASYHDMYYMNPPAKDLSKIASSDKVKKVQKDFEATHVRPERLMKTLFTDEAYVKANVDEARLMRRLLIWLVICRVMIQIYSYILFSRMKSVMIYGVVTTYIGI